MGMHDDGGHPMWASIRSLRTAAGGWPHRGGRPIGGEGRRLAEAAFRWPLGEKDWMAGDGQGTR